MAERGHRLVAHTADLIIEAWAPTRIECLEEAVRALVSSVTATVDVPVTDPLEFALEPEDDEALLVSLLEEAVYVIDVVGIPVGTHLEEADDGGIAGIFDVAPHHAVEQTGPAPKGITRNELAFGLDGDRWRARVTIDV